MPSAAAAAAADRTSAASGSDLSTDHRSVLHRRRHVRAVIAHHRIDYGPT